MSVLFYRRPEHQKKPNGPISSSDCARYVERAKKSERSIPFGLAFEDVINNRSLPPCSLDDFMDYLIYVEHNAENLQFYLWYNDYVLRFNALPSHQRALSPQWISERPSIPIILTKNSEKIPRSGTNREILTALMRHGYDTHDSVIFGDDNSRPLSVIRESNSSEVASSITLTETDIGVKAGMKWQPFTIQPMRDEINRTILQYLAFAAPRELNLSHRDRAQCLHALQHTTHPSALLPALTIVTAALRGQSHPNFIRHSICNSNQPRVVFVRALGFLTTISGFLLATILVFSSCSRYYRFLPSILWYLGITTLVAAYKGLCVVLHYGGHGRMRREWELVGEERDLNGLGGRRRKGWWGEVFQRNVWIQDGNLRGLQDRIVLGSNLWAMLGTAVLTVGVLFLPVVGLF